MSTDPSQIFLTPEQQRWLAELADSAGRPWPAVLDDAIAEYRRKRPADIDQGSLKAVFGAGKGVIEFAPDSDEPIEDFSEYAE